jgi:mono/diheme cytochrome c family protein
MTRIALAAIAACLAGTAVQAEELVEGKRLYDEFCVACHGAMGKGGGELTDLLTVEVPDLSHLADRNDGTFPMLEVIHIIDGRTGLRAHGGPMPVYGSMFSNQSALAGTGYGSVIETRGRVLSLAMYLESIQE